MSVTVQLRTLVAFATGLALALIAVFVFQAWRVDAAPGDTDTTFVPITPCRLVDTRPTPFRVGPHGGFGIEDTRTIAARGTNGDCTIANDAVGLSLNVTAVGSSQATFLTFWSGGARPNASSLNPAPGQPPTPNAVTTSLSGSGSFNVYNKAGNVDVIIDIGGYYIKTSLQALRDAMPFAVHAENHDKTDPLPIRDVDPPLSVIEVNLTTPATAGTVTVTASTWVGGNGTILDFVQCQIAAGDLTDFEPTLPTLAGSPNEQFVYPQIAGTRGVDVAPNTNITFKLLCAAAGGGDQYASDRSMTAIFTPAP